MMGDQKISSSHPLSVENVFQDLQWMSETIIVLNPIYTVFPIYNILDKVQLVN